MNTEEMQRQINRVHTLPRAEPEPATPVTRVQRPTATIPLYGSPCAGCGQPAREMHLYPNDSRVVVHMVGDKQQPCRITGLAGGAL